MAEPLRERVLVALVAKLQAIVGNRFWGTPYPTPPRVERPLKVPENPTQLLWVRTMRFFDSMRLL